MPTRHVSRTGTFHLPMPPQQAFLFFTPEGERAYVPDWRPEYVYPEDGRLQRGLVWRTNASGEPTLWLVVRFDEERLDVEYARVVPDSRMGTVSVRCLAAQDGGTDVTVTYELTALSEAGERTLAAMTDEAYAATLQEWRTAILAL